MTINIGDKFPQGTVAFYESQTLKTIGTDEMFKNKRVILFGMPGAFTPTCSQYHIPSIINQIENYKTKGIDDIFCLVVNDVYVTNIWSKQTGATQAGLQIVSDPCGNLVKKIGMSFNAPQIGFLDRSIRFCLILNEGIVERVFKETKGGTCDITSGENILAQI